MQQIIVTDLLKQMSIAIPSIIAATMTLTAAIHGIFDIKKAWVNHLVSWLIAIAAAEAFVAFNGLTFGLAGWDYLVGAVCGILAGASANGIYDWKSVKSLFDAITALFAKRA